MTHPLSKLKKESLLELYRYLDMEPFGFKPNKKDILEVLKKTEHWEKALEALKAMEAMEALKEVEEINVEEVETMEVEEQNDISRVCVQKYGLSSEAKRISTREAQVLMESVIVVKTIISEDGSCWVFNLQSFENPRHVTVLYMIHDFALCIIDKGAGTKEPLLNLV